LSTLLKKILFINRILSDIIAKNKNFLKGISMSGKELRLKKLFRGKKNLVLSAFDHVFFYGDQPGLENEREAIKNCLTTDGFIIPRFMLKRNWDLLGDVNSPAPIVRINWSSSFYYPLDYREGNTAIATTVEDAIEAGAEAIICSLFIEEKDAQEREAKNVALFSEVVRQKEKLGIPLIGECYVVEYKDMTAEQVHNKVRRVSRVMAELGADLIKTFFTGDRFHEVVENTPVPVFTIGAEKLKTDLEVLKKAEASIKQGARGIIFGRNIFMAKEPAKLVKALDEVMNEGISSQQAAEKYHLI
jgi:DhnA family fructose-bisphosphate aldolase class Ia